jgi:hypothetical protein
MRGFQCGLVRKLEYASEKVGQRLELDEGVSWSNPLAVSLEEIGERDPLKTGHVEQNLEEIDERLPLTTSHIE